MAAIRPFRGLHYNLEKIERVSDVITPPYDVISADQRQSFLARSPWNVIRLILPEGEAPYENASHLLRRWMAEKIVVQAHQPALYCYHQTFTTSAGGEKTRTGFIALIKLEPFEKGIVLPHEATLSAPKEDRLNLLRACKANFSPIFGIYSDPEQIIDGLLEPFTSGPPDFVAEDDGGVTNSVWNVSDPAVIREIQKQMGPKWVLIADGHHRYESCLLYRDEMSATNQDPDAPFQFTMMFLTNIHHPGITVLPYNRGVRNVRDFDGSAVLKKAEKYFEIRKFDGEAQAMRALEQEGRQATAFAALLQGLPGFYLFQLRPEVSLAQFYPSKTPEAVQTLDVNIVHKVMIQHVLGITEEEIRRESFLKYYKEIQEEKKDFVEGRLQIGFFLNPTRIEQVVEVSKAGAKMPQKSTFFYPKLMTGFVINLH